MSGSGAANPARTTIERLCVTLAENGGRMEGEALRATTVFGESTFGELIRESVRTGYMAVFIVDRTVALTYKGQGFAAAAGGPAR